MNVTYILYNPKSGNRDCEEKIKALRELYSARETEFINITAIDDYKAFCDGLHKSDEIVICGGDGTLNRFVNEIYDLNLENNIYFYAMGTGNDFLRDLDKSEGAEPFLVNEYIKELPVVTVNGRDYRFINAVGFGIDGYCCEVGDKIRSENKKLDYTAIAIKGLLGGYKPTAARVTVDGVTKEYKKIWIAPTMFGRYYGGGMMPAPLQTRDNKEKAVSFAAIHTAGKLKTLCVFPSIFKGEHVSHSEMVDVISGHDVTVEFDRPVALQIDGETFLGISKYQVRSAACVRNADKAQAAAV